ncbi:hypothetical protein BDP67DRAFT_536086 [Colletotrichum lupini]|nr:hypothetical protein BDP67DRAFT_536086 [Colletotrichum lupini]
MRWFRQNLASSFLACDVLMACHIHNSLLTNNAHNRLGQRSTAASPQIRSRSICQFQAARFRRLPNSTSVSEHRGIV